MNTLEATVLNPAWDHIFGSPLNPALGQDEQRRVLNWIKSLAIPHIEKNLEDFCVKVFTSDVRMEMEEREVSMLGGQTAKYAGKMSLQLEAFANSKDLRRPGISHAIMNDPWVTSLNMTYDNFDRYTSSSGWLSSYDNRYQYRENYDTRLSIDIVSGDHMKKIMMPGQQMWLFMGHSALTDIRDWLTTAAHVPLNATKLPWKEAVRLSAKWHDDEAKRRQKAALRKITRGSRVPIGKLQVASGSLNVGDKYEVFWLTDKAALEYETVLQHHCVWSYWDRVQNGQCAILHVRNTDPEKETDRWTVDVRPLMWGHNNTTTLKISQMRGVVNRDPHPEFPQAISNMLELGRCLSVFTEDSYLDSRSLLDHFTLPPGVTRAVP